MYKSNNTINVDRIIGQEVKKILFAKGIKQKDFSKSIGWATDNTSQKITGKRGWKAKHIHELCRYFNLSVVFTDEITLNDIGTVDYPETPDIEKVASKALFDIIAESNMSQVDLAQRLGCSSNLINAQIHGNRGINAQQIFNICLATKSQCIFDGITIKFFKL